MFVCRFVAASHCWFYDTRPVKISLGGCLGKPVCATMFVFVYLGEGYLCRTVSKLGCSGLLLVGGPKCVKIHHGVHLSHTQNVKNLGHLDDTSCLDDIMNANTHTHTHTKTVCLNDQWPNGHPPTFPIYRPPLMAVTCTTQFLKKLGCCLGCE